VPAPLLRLIFGELADAALLANSATSARKAIASGYSFLFPEIDEALRFEVA
jgi:NAD dependent epimerase/dehydratase family enzyme